VETFITAVLFVEMAVRIHDRLVDLITVLSHWPK
jgi:hypothetical protein